MKNWQKYGIEPSIEAAFKKATLSSRNVYLDGTYKWDNVEADVYFDCPHFNDLYVYYCVSILTKELIAKDNKQGAA